MLRVSGVDKPSFANNTDANKTAVVGAKVKKNIGNWVAGDDFFDRKAELEALTERAKEGTHTLLTAQRRMGKTSLVRELLRRLDGEDVIETIFVDLQAADTPADAIAEIAFQGRVAQGAWLRIGRLLKKAIPRKAEISGRLPGTELHVNVGTGVGAGNWQHKGDQLFRALARRGNTVLALDELPILVNRMLKGDDYTITPERKRAADEFLGWLRKNGQEHRGKITMILSGSVGLEPILQQAGLSAHANIFSPFDLKPWDDKTASECLGALADSYGLYLPQDVRTAMCKRLRCQIPNHVQRFFDALHEDLRRAGRCAASLDDVDRVYETEMLGVRGQMDMPHYEERLRVMLGDEGCRVAHDLLADAAVADGQLEDAAIVRQRQLQADEANPVPIDDVLHVLEHDGYFEKHEGGYRFISGLLEDWWRTRYGRSRASTSTVANLAPSTNP